MRALVFLLMLLSTPALADCVAGSGHDYQVGIAAGQISPNAVPWNNLQCGDSVRFFYNGSPYRTKFAVNALCQPPLAAVTICGVASATGAKPVIEGSGATTPPNVNYGRASASLTNQQETLLWIGSKDTDTDVRAPANITVSGLIWQNANPTFHFTAADGSAQTYAGFGACLWVGVGHNITFDGNETYNCTQGYYVRSQDNGTCTPANVQTCPNISTNTVIRNFIIDGYGIANDDHEHGIYTETVGLVIENGWIKQPWPNAGGNAIKDRSVGTVIRYNTINSGSRAFDLVEAEDMPNYALSDPNYRKTYVYGNLVNKSGLLGVHYGYDNGSANDRAGTFYLWDNTFDLQGDPSEGVAYLLDLESINDHVQMWNNVYKCDLSATKPNYRCALREVPDEGSGGTVNLGVNWFDNSNGNCNRPFCDGDGVRAQQPTGPLTGQANVITGLASPLDANFVPLTNGPADNSAQAQLPDVASYPVQFENSVAGVVSTRPSVADLGAIETGASPPPTCGAAPPIASQTVQCPAGTTGTWTQTHGWDSAPYPTCWTAQAWTPTSPPAGACTPIPPPPTTYKVTIKAGTQTLVLPSVDNVTAIQITLAVSPLHWHVAYAGMTPYDFSGASKLTMTETVNTTKPPTIITPPSGGPAK